VPTARPAPVPCLPNRIVKTALWIATALVAAAVAFPYVAPALLGT
jgi:mercuric ion transport protein